MSDTLRQLPSVDRLLNEPDVQGFQASFGRQATVDAVRAVLDAARQDLRSGGPAPGVEALIAGIGERLNSELAPTLRPAINATGVIIHTNLGRAPLSLAARRAIGDVARGYSNLEYDLEAGARGQRTVHAEQLLCRLTGAESALVVNNNAGGVLLALSGLAAGRRGIVSRGQLVEIGGGFRVPDVMLQSGCRLVEVGTTNRTHLRDYAAALEAHADVALVLRVHPSNFRIVGFTAEPALADLVDLAHSHGVAVLDDLGSGALLDTRDYGLAHEPMVQESVAAGADVICFSGDKLLGGPQAGIIVGRAQAVDPLKRHPLARALRADKLCLAGLQATLLSYLRGTAAQDLPVWRMMATSPAELERRAAAWAQHWQAAGVDARVVAGRSTIGGGSLPGETLPTWLVALFGPAPDAGLARLRQADPPIIARIQDDVLVVDPRTVLSDEEPVLLEAVARAISATG